jgi:hypothetical protein
MVWRNQEVWVVNGDVGFNFNSATNSATRILDLSRLLFPHVKLCPITTGACDGLIQAGNKYKRVLNKLHCK